MQYQASTSSSRFNRLAANVLPRRFYFKKPVITSRGTLRERQSWFIIIYHKENPEIRGIGECAPLKGLSIDDRPDFSARLREVCDEISSYPHWLGEGLKDFPAIKFGLEAALLDYCSSGKRILYPSAFTDGKDSIRINGLIWMGDVESMQRQAEEKIAAGFRCIKMKIGALDFELELELLKFIRKNYSEKEIELRVDANGAFTPEEALEKLEQLSKLKIHSIEQPIKHGQRKQMAELCRKSPVPVALDEELIGVKSFQQKKALLSEISPQYIILKPALLGGFSESLEWIKLAKELGIGWWVTSALESNIGLNAIAQWTYTLGNRMPQGLGTGQLYDNNFDSPLYVQGENLFHHPGSGWKLPDNFK
ncbi:MAG TPA: o-succinylbenzoate synthase [Chitinophagales bacterium]|nr:o-succinylbenzoate synthase [Chitinophagales bacterium]